MTTSSTTTRRASYGPRICRNGRTERYSADSMSLLRIAYIKHVAEHHLRAEASASTIIRQALAFYCEHIDSLVDLDAEDAQVQREARALNAVKRGQPAEVTEDDVKQIPLKPLKQIISDYHASQPSMAEWMRMDLERMKRLDEETERLYDDGR